ncbi:MAG: FAD-dependent oxidoreductase [Sandaracinaceae bacterium]|nr:FAD-dependent oxidoreductase [Sandaracinaceae bacterium]MBK7772643.1 FAD-dependent oxidoreductase [Sandaracinaceae bacterium]MBK8406847.1 FAD-dependent oxidoreductase [Sandaracinaceae bacterium]
MAKKQTDVLIIGGGWTGVSAATELAKLGVDFQLLEADPVRLGGRAYSFEYNPNPSSPHKLYWEHGAQYVGQDQTAIWALIQEHCPDQLVDGYALRKPYREQIMLVDGKRYCYDRDKCLFDIGGLPPGIGLFDLLATVLMIDQIQTIERAIDVLEPWNSPKELLALDQLAMDEWLGADWMPPGARSLVSVAVNAVISVEPPQISPFYFFWYSACNDGFLQECNDEEGGPQQYYLRCGVDALVQKVADPIRDKITFGAVVSDITRGDATVTVTTASGDVWEASQVVVAMSPHTVGKLAFTPALPDGYKALCDQPMGRTIKCMLFYSEPWWRSSHTLAYTGYSGASSFPVTWVMDYSPEDGSGVWCLMTFTIGDYVTDLGPNPSKEAVTELVTKNLCFLFDDPRALVDGGLFVGLQLFTWNEYTPFSGGGPNTVFGPNMLTGPAAPAKTLNQALDGNVWFAAAELARKVDPGSVSRYFDPATQKYSDIRHSLGYMDGAINEGRFVANQVAKALGRTYDTRIDATYPSTPPKVSLPGPTTDIPVAKVRDILKSFTTIAFAKAAYQASNPVDPMDLIEQFGTMFGLALAANFKFPDRATMQSVIGAGYRYASSPATDDVTEQLRYYVGILNGLVSVLSAETKAAAAALPPGATAPRGRFAALSRMAAGIDKGIAEGTPDGA